MFRLSLLSAVALFVLSAGHSLQAAPTTGPDGTLRWARGVVSAVSADTLTLKLRNKTVTIGVDSSTVFASTPAIGAIVEAHFTDARNVLRAVLVFPDTSGSTEVSKSMGRSYRGVTVDTKHSRLKIDIGQKTREVDLDKKTRLLGVDGRNIATGKSEVVPMLQSGETVLVKYFDEDQSTMSGDLYLPASSTTALEVRKLSSQ